MILRHEIYDADGLMEVREVYRDGSSGEVRTRILDGTRSKVGDREPTRGEATKFVEREERIEEEKKAKRGQQIRDAIELPPVLDRVDNQGMTRQEVLDLWVKANQIDPEDAEALGWTPPTLE